MKHLTRVLIALAVFFSGAALVPMIGLPTEGFSWQRYAGAYTLARLSSNHPSGQPGSFFTIRGEEFTPNTSVTISANGVALGSVPVDDQGKFRFLLNTTGADPGYYRIVASGTESASLLIRLEQEGTLWPQDGSGTIFILPPGIEIHILFLPKVTR